MSALCIFAAQTCFVIAKAVCSQHMPSDRPGIIMRKGLLALLEAHDEAELPSWYAQLPIACRYVFDELVISGSRFLRIALNPSGHSPDRRVSEPHLAGSAPARARENSHDRSGM
jgi:hypothetical protein